MSHSPDELPEEASLGDLAPAYVQSVVRLNQMLERGVSWSGHEANCCFLNVGEGGAFATVSSVTGLDFLDDGRGLGLVDWDHDGDLDAWASNRTAPMLRFVRNDLPPGNHYLAIRLEGVTCNNDAIGARVEVRLRGDSGARLLRTLRAGEGFLGQSSKWLHFGLGKNDQIHQLIVHWPGGESEVISGVKVDGHYVIRQGSGSATRWQPSRRRELAPTPLAPPQSSDESRIRLTSRLPLPPLEVKSYGGEALNATEGQSGPVLLNLWASWCAPCLQELREFSEREQELRDAGLRVVALNVDGLGDDRGGSIVSQKAMLERLGYAFDSGSADAALVTKIELIVNYVLGPNRTLPVPISLLLDESGRLAVIYRGKASVDELLLDARELGHGDGEQHQTALPFPGRWIGKPPAFRPLGLAAELLENGFDDEVLAYIDQHQEQFRRDKDFAKLAAEITRSLVASERYSVAVQHLQRAVSLASRDAELRAQLGEMLLRQGRVDEADARFSEAITIDPNNAIANYQRGGILVQRGQLTAATQHFERAVAANPSLAEAHYQLAALLFQQRQAEKAIGHMQRFVELRPENANARVNLGAMLAARRRFAEAEQQLQLAVQAEPSNAMAHNNLGRVLLDQGKDAAALPHFRAAMRDSKSRVQATLNLVRLLATSSDTQVRNAKQAIVAARQCAAATDRGRPDVLEVLAMAYAADAQFAAAIETATEALKLARAARDQRLVTRLTSSIKSYRQRAASSP